MKNETTNKKTSSNNEELLTNKKTSSNNEELLANNNIQYEEQCELIENIFNTYKAKIENLEDKKRVKYTDKNLTREQIENEIKKELELIQKDEEKFLKKVKATKEKINEIENIYKNFQTIFNEKTKELQEHEQKFKELNEWSAEKIKFLRLRLNEH